MELNPKKLVFGDLDQISKIKEINNKLSDIFSTQKKLKKYCEDIGIMQEYICYTRDRRDISREIRNAGCHENKKYFQELKKQEKKKFMNRIIDTIYI